MFILCDDSAIPQCLLFDIRASAWSILCRIAQCNGIMDSDEREACYNAMGEASGAMVWDCITQSNSRAHFVSRMRHAIDYNNAAIHDQSERHATTLKAARLAVVKVDTMVVRNGMPTYVTTYTVPVGEINGRFYTAQRNTYRSLSGALSAARARVADHANRFFPTTINSHYRLA